MLNDLAALIVAVGVRVIAVAISCDMFADVFLFRWLVSSLVS